MKEGEELYSSNHS